MDRKNHLKGDNVKDPEKAMQRDAAKKRKAAMNPFKVARDEFAAWYISETKRKPDWTQPAISWMFAGWIASEGERDWFTAEEIEENRLRSEATKKRMAKMKETKRLKEAEAAAKAAARKKATKKAAAKKAAPKKVAKNMYRRKT